MLRLHSLGRFALLDEDGRNLDAGVKPLALLVYLVVRGGGVRRDELTALFWSEADTDSARSALRSSLYRLRRAAGAELVRSSSADTVSANDELVSCDAVAFQKAADAGDWKTAMELYGGDFLPAVHLPGESGFADWIGRHRDGLRATANEACWVLARAAAPGDAAVARAWARRAGALDPFSETEARRLLQFLADLGDRAGLVRAYREIRARLEADLELPPSEETVALYQALETQLAKDQAPRRTDLAPETAAAEPLEPAADERAGPRRLPLWARIGVPAVALATVMLWFRPLLSDAPTAGAVAVLPFSYSGDPSRAYLGTGVSDILQRRLEMLDGVRIVDVRGLVGQTDSGAAPVHAVVAEHGAAYYLTGSVHVVGEQLELTAEIRTADTRGDVIRSARSSGELTATFELIDGLVAPLMTATEGVGGANVPGRAAPSLDVLRAYLDGEEHLREGRYEAALQSFRQAVLEDTAFAWSYYGLSRAAAWTGRSPETEVAIERAWELRDQLPARERDLLEAWRIAHLPDAATADSLFARIVEDFPRYGEAWLRLAEHRYHWSPLVGMPVVLGQEAFERAVNVMPRNASALIHLARLTLRRDDGPAVVLLTARARALQVGTAERAEIDVIDALARRDSATVLAQMESTEINKGGLAYLLLTMAPSLELSLWGLRALARAEDHVEVSVSLLRRVVSMGRLQEADRVLDILTRRDLTLGQEYPAEIATLPILPTDSERLAAARRTIEAMPVQRAEEVGRYLRPGELHPSRKFYLLGLLALAEGDLEGATALAQRITREAHDSSGADYRSRTLLAAAQLRRGDPQGALATLGPPVATYNRLLPGAKWFEMPRHRYARAEALAAAGRAEAALDVYRSFPEPAGSDVPYLPAVRFGEARLLLSLGRREEAHRAYDDYLLLLASADDDVASRIARIPELEDARGEPPGR